jgi:tetratricopeptide (TPR) repeat protein
VVKGVLCVTLLAGSHALAQRGTKTTGAFEREFATARDLIRNGSVGEALKKLDDLQRRFNNDPDAKLEIGNLFQELAAERASQLQNVAPNSAAAHQLVGKSFEAQGRLRDALNEYKLALQSDSKIPGMHFLAGNVERKLGDIQAAQTDLAEELRLNPHHAAANLRMGEISLELNRERPERAIAYLQEAVANNDASLEAHLELGKALRLSRRYQEALTQLKLVETRRPDDDSVHAQLSALYRNTGNAEKAREEMELHARILQQKLDASKRARAERQK